jgi:hypothetical protein
VHQYDFVVTECVSYCKFFISNNYRISNAHANRNAYANGDAHSLSLGRSDKLDGAFLL